jgi:hypothetical protein
MFFKIFQILRLVNGKLKIKDFACFYEITNFDIPFNDSLQRPHSEDLTLRMLIGSRL